MILGDVALPLPLSLCLQEEGAVISGHALVGACPSPRPSPRKRREGEDHRCAGGAKTKRGPAFPPAPRCRHPRAGPSGRRARHGGGRQCSASGKGLRNPAFQRSRCVRWPVTGTGAVPKSRVPASMSLRYLAPCGIPASRSGHRSTRSPKGCSARSPRVGSFARRLPVPSRLWLHLRDGPKGTAAPLQPAPPGPKTGFASMASGPTRCPKASAPARPPVTPGTSPKDAIGRLSVPFAQSRCEHRLHGFPGWRPRPDPCGFPKAPARFRP